MLDFNQLICRCYDKYNGILKVFITTVIINGLFSMNIIHPRRDSQNSTTSPNFILNVPYRVPTGRFTVRVSCGHRKPLSYLVLIENDGLPENVTGGPSSVVWPRYFAVEGTLVGVRAIFSTWQKLAETLAGYRAIQRDPGRFFNPVNRGKSGRTRGILGFRVTLW